MGGRAFRMEVQKGKLNHPTVIRGHLSIFKLCHAVVFQGQSRSQGGAIRRDRAAFVSSGSRYRPTFFWADWDLPMYDLFGGT